MLNFLDSLINVYDEKPYGEKPYGEIYGGICDEICCDVCHQKHRPSDVLFRVHLLQISFWD